MPHPLEKQADSGLVQTDSGLVQTVAEPIPAPAIGPAMAASFFFGDASRSGKRRRLILAGLGAVALAALGAALIDRGDPPPASAETLDQIAAKNKDAAVAAAARMKAESEASARAADAQLERDQAAAPSAQPRP